MDPLETRLFVLESKIEISELRARYAWYVARAMADQLVGLFTDDCRFSAREGEPIIGRAGLHEHLSRLKPIDRLPLIQNEIIEVKSDLAAGACAMFIPFVPGTDGGLCGYYHDHFRRENGKWLFSMRRFRSYWPVYNPLDHVDFWQL
jgi:hypothetical protein